MTKWKNTRGGRVRIKALPDKLSCSGCSPGEVKLMYENRSCVPVDLEVNWLKTDDIQIAESSLHTNPSTLIIHVPRRPNASAKIPGKKENVLGPWSPKTQGNTTVRAKTDLYDISRSFLGTALPDDDLEVM